MSNSYINLLRTWFKNWGVKSTPRSVILSVSIFLLYFLFYFVVRKFYYDIINTQNYFFISRRYFFISYSAVMLPVFVFLFFKFNIFTNFWNKLEKPHLIDYLFFSSLCLFLYISFNHGDLQITSVHGKMLLDIVCRGDNILDFYDYNKGTAVYLLPQYILFAIWSIPVKIGYFIMGFSPIELNQLERITGFTLWWYKLLPTLFYLASGFFIYQIGTKLTMDKHKAKWMSFVWFIFPMGVFSQFIFGQYDSIGVFLELLMIYSFLQKRLMKASLICMFAITFKMFPYFIFIPLLLLFEKKILKIFGFIAVSFIGYMFFSLLFAHSFAFNNSGSFFIDMVARLFAVGIETPLGRVSFFVSTFFITSVWAYFVKPKDEFIVGKYILYIPLVIYSAFFSFVLFHPQWILVLVPYLVINIFINRNPKGMMLISLVISISFFFFTMKSWIANVDANMINNGVFPYLFGFFNIDNNGHGFKSLGILTSLGGRIPNSPYFTLFVSMLIINLVLSFPNVKNIILSKKVLKLPFSAERDIVWINGLTVLLFAIPAVLLFFASGSLK